MSGNVSIKGQGRGPSLRPAIIDHFKAHPGEIVWLKDLVAMLPAEPATVQKAINNMMRANPALPVVVEKAGQAWSYDPNGNRNVRKRKFVEIGVSSKSGRIIIEDEGNGKIYIATEAS